MTLPRSAAEVLARHVLFELECIDRIYCNLYVPRLQRELGVASFIREHLGKPVASTAVLAAATARERAGLYRACGVPGARPMASDRAFSPRLATKVSKLARCSVVARCAAWSRPAAARVGRTRLMAPPSVGSGSAWRPSARARRRLTSSWDGSNAGITHKGPSTPSWYEQ